MSSDLFDVPNDPDDDTPVESNKSNISPPAQQKSARLRI